MKFLQVFHRELSECFIENNIYFKIKLTSIAIFTIFVRNELKYF